MPQGKVRCLVNLSGHRRMKAARLGASSRGAKESLYPRKLKSLARLIEQQMDDDTAGVSNV